MTDAETPYVTITADTHAGASIDMLTIPKGKSTEFNQEKFSKGKHKGHFSDDIK